MPNDPKRAGGLRPEPAAQSQPEALIPSAKAFVCDALKARIAEMLTELEHPPLIDRIFPKGWQNGSYEDLMALYELCRRTFDKRGRANG